MSNDEDRRRFVIRASSFFRHSDFDIRHFIGEWMLAFQSAQGWGMYKFLLCWRYLRTRYIALASIISVMLGVATMIVVNSVMAGFSTEMRERIHGILADIVVEVNSTDGEFNAERHMARIREVAGDYVEAMSPTVEIYGMLSFKYVGQYITRPVTLIGIDPESKSKVGTLAAILGNYNATVEKGQRI